MNVSKQIVDILEKLQVKHIYGVTGDALNGIVDEIRKSEHLQWIAMRHEENAAFAAYAEAAVTGHLAVCAGTVGPGALHLINGLYNAKKERVPVLALSGQVSLDNVGTGYFQEVDLKKIYDDVCAYQAVVRSPEQVPRILQRAIQTAMSARAVCRVEIPHDVSLMEAAGGSFIHPVVCRMGTIAPDEQSVRDAADMINENEKITILAGEGCRHAKSEVLQLSEKLKAPIVHSLKASDIFHHNTPNVVGLTGLIGNTSGYHAVMDADVLLMIGTDFPYINFLPDHKQVIQIDIRPENLGNRTAIGVGIHGDARLAVRQLSQLTTEKNNRKFLDQLLESYRDWRSDMAAASDPGKQAGGLIRPQVLTGILNEKASDDAIFIADVGTSTIWAAHHLVMRGDRRLLGSFNHGSMAVGLPAALGAQAVDRDRQVWALVGDGAFGMSMHDFITAVRYDWPINVIVFNNSELGFVKMEMEEAGLPRYDEALRLENPDFAAYAEICGAVGIKVEAADEIAPAIDKALATSKPCIIDVMVSPGELSLPPKITLEQAWGFTKSKVKETLLAMKGDQSQWENIKEELKAAF